MMYGKNPADAREALAVVRDELRAGTLVHVPDMPTLEQADTKVQKGYKGLPAARCFNMNYIDEQYPCGSVCCIGGWAAKLLGRKKAAEWMEDVSAHDVGLYDLFFQHTDDKTTPNEAAEAIDNYLKVGKPMWRKVLFGEDEPEGWDSEGWAEGWDS